MNTYNLRDVSGLKYLYEKYKMPCSTFPVNMYQGCMCLKKAYVPAFTSAPTTSNNSYLENMFSNCRRLEDIEWGMDVIPISNSYPYSFDFSKIGWFHSTLGTTALAQGVAPEECKVTDLESYERLKNNDMWWSDDVNFSHLNHTNIVNIFKHLPQHGSIVTSASKKGSIKVVGAMGSGYGDPISDLTPEEIAIAVDKGWGVSIA